jgi:hypothetical protein
MNNVVKALLAYKGEYEGQGINHEGQPFVGRLSLRPVVHDKGISVSSIL